MTWSAGRRLRFGAGLLSLLCVVVWIAGLTRTGLGLQVRGPGGSVSTTYPHANLGTLRIDSLLARGAGPLRAVWTGYWAIPAPGFTELVLKSDGEAAVLIDGETLLGIGSPEAAGNRKAVTVAPGVHRVQIVYEPGPGPGHEIFLKGVTQDGLSTPLERSQTWAEKPSAMERVVSWAAPWLFGLAALLWAGLLVREVREGDRGRPMARTSGVLLAFVLIVAAGFRFEALVMSYWGPEAPDWAEALATQIEAWRPGAFQHLPVRSPYEGDPFSYLQIARSMGFFFEPSAREPLFPALTRLALVLNGGRDIGISMLSAVSSTLTCAAIFALGLRLGSAGAGVAAAGLWAIEWQVISFSVQGWRDDLFTLQVAACAALLVLLHLRPGRWGSLALGLAGGLTLLTRLSALTFLVPGVFAAVVLPGGAARRDRLREAGIALVLMAMLAGPFMAACAIGFGDPFYAVNVHAGFYEGRAGMPDRGNSTALGFLARTFLPWEAVHTGFIGLTSYPFMNKWSGLGALFPGLGEVVRLLALAGAPILLLRPGGLVALVVLFSAIAPYAWTWEIPGGAEWRFTLPAYPFYLVSAMLAVQAGVRAVLDLAASGKRSRVLKSAIRVGFTGLGLIAVGVATARGLSWQRADELARHDRPVRIEAGWPARWFFEAGWSLVGNPDSSAVFAMSEPEARLQLPYPDQKAAQVVLRLGSTRGTPSRIDVFAGEDRIGSFSGARGQGATETLEIAPHQGRRGGVIALRFATVAPGLNPDFTILWVRVEPPLPSF